MGPGGQRKRLCGRPFDVPLDVLQTAAYDLFGEVAKSELDKAKAEEVRP